MAATSNNAQGTKAEVGWQIVNAYDLYIKNLPPTKWIVDPIIHEGATLLIGDPKVGKSFFGLQVAAAVAGKAEKLLGMDICTHGTVLYLALDDGNEKRLQKRIRDLQIPEEATKNIDFVYQRNLPDLSNGFDTALDQLLTQRKYVLVILDTFGAVLGKQAGKNVYREDYQEAIRLQKLAQKHEIALLVIHHTNKGESTDVIARSSGSHGLTGAVDSVLMLARQDGYALLSARPRDAEESAYRLERETNGSWRRTSQFVNLSKVSLDDDPVTPERQDILALLWEGAKNRDEVANVLGISAEAARKRLERMRQAGQIQKNPDGTFAIAVRVAPKVVVRPSGESTTATKLH